VKIRYVEKPYHFTPLTILKRKMVRVDVGDEEIEKLVRFYVDYVRSYIYRFDNRDKAYYEWVYEKVPWLRRKINREEVEFLNSIIQRSWTHAASAARAFGFWFVASRALRRL